MQIVFGSGVTTGRFAMGSREPIGRPADIGTTKNQSEMIEQDGVEFVNVADPFKSPESAKSTESSQGLPKNPGKRKQVSEDDCELMIGLTAAVNNVAENLNKLIKDDRAMYSELYQAVMGVEGFTQETLMFALSHMLDNKSQGFSFLEMSEPHRVLWPRTFLGKHYYL
jgi:hypothetical protein